MKKRSKKTNLPPGSLVYVGEERGKTPLLINVIDYDETTYEEKTINDIKECFVFKGKPTVTWMDMESVHNPAPIEKLGECFGFHPLVLEDVMNTDQRAKTEDFGEYIYIVMKMLDYSATDGEIKSEQVSVIFGENYLLSFQEGMAGDAFGSVRARLKTSKGRIRKMGPDYLAYSIIDATVDRYFAVLEQMTEKIEVLEDAVVAHPTVEVLNEIHELKRRLLYIRKIVWPLREVINSLQKSDSALVSDHTRIYMRDVYDHVIHIIDTVETLREMVSGLLDVYLSGMSIRMNEVMKVLTIIATLFMPITFLVGVYGMNFKHMPELEWPWGYPLLWVVMLSSVAVMLLFFRRKRWI